MDEPLAPMFEALSDGTRRGVLMALARQGPATATQLAGEFPVSRQAVAKHLQVLLDAGLVEAERAGRETRFSFVSGSFGTLERWIRDLDPAGADAWEQGVAAWQRHLEEQHARRGLSPERGPLRAAASARRPPPRA